MSYQIQTARLFLALIALLTASALSSLDAYADTRGIAVFSFVPLDQESEAAAVDLTKSVIASLKRSGRLTVLVESDLPPEMQDPSEHDQWPKSDLLAFALEGSVRKRRNGTAITVQLLSTSSNGHVWSERFESAKADIEKVVAAVQREVESATER